MLWPQEIRDEIIRRFETESTKSIAEDLTKRFGVQVSGNAVTGVIDRYRKRKGLARPTARNAKRDGETWLRKRQPAVRLAIAKNIPQNIPMNDATFHWNGESAAKRRARPIFELTIFECRWPVADATEDHPALFCARAEANIAESRPYCCEHDARAKGEGTSFERRAHRV
jgi:hypothetical protein